MPEMIVGCVVGVDGGGGGGGGGVVSVV